MPRETSTGRILTNDYGSLLMLIGIGVNWALAIGGSVLGFLPKRNGGGTIEVNDAMMTSLLAVAVLMTLLMTLLMGWLAARRIGDLKRIVRDGHEAKGRIMSIDFFRNRGRVEYEYQHAGKTYRAGNAIWKNHETTQLNNGDEITLIVDPQNPSRALIASLYT